MSQPNSVGKFFCSWCVLTFSGVDGKGKAICPKCKRSRGDNFNQVSANSVSCLKCSCHFTYSIGSEKKISCPNNCN